MRGATKPILLLLCCGAPLWGAVRAGEPMPGTRPASEATRAAVDQIARRVEAIRGLRFKIPVPVSTVARSALREYADHRIGRFADADQLAAEETVYGLLGFIPRDTSLVGQYSRAIEEVAAAYYDPERKEFYLIEDLPDGAAPILAAHELTHALDDQYYDLDARIARSASNGDRAFVTMAIHEGSATIAMAVYVAQALANGWVRRENLEALAEAEAAEGERLAAMPDVLRRPLLGAYVLGARFLGRGKELGLGTGGFPKEDADRCFRDGPVSSEQILHPEKFWDPEQRDDPQEVISPDVRRVLGRGWRRVGEGVLGEIGLGLLVGAPTPSTWTAESLRGENWSNTASAGWDGDRWELWADDERVVVILASVWDREEDAQEFADVVALRPGLASRREGTRVAIVAGGPGKPRARDKLLREILRPRPR